MITRECIKLDIESSYESPRKTQSSPSSGGIYNLREDHDHPAKYTSLSRKANALELKMFDHLILVQDITCHIYCFNDHSTQDC